MEIPRLPVLRMQACIAFQSHPYLAIDNRKSRKVIESGKQPFESLHFDRKPSISFLPSPDFRDADDVVCNRPLRLGEVSLELGWLEEIEYRSRHPTGAGSCARRGAREVCAQCAGPGPNLHLEHQHPTQRACPHGALEPSRARAGIAHGAPRAPCRAQAISCPCSGIGVVRALVGARGHLAPLELEYTTGVPDDVDVTAWGQQRLNAVGGLSGLGTVAPADAADAQDQVPVDELPRH
jgi:hypothetical protein